MSKFSIIIPLFNKENFIKNTLQSVLNQTFNDFEIIIINDGSTDNSIKVINTIDDDRIKIIHQKNQGVSIARNHGIELAQGQYICFLDADDYWYPHFLQTFHELTLKYKNESVFSAAFEVETKWKTFASLYSIDNSQIDLIVNFFDASKQECVIWTSCAVFKKSVFENVGNFDSSIKIAQDTDLWIRIGLKYPIAFTWNILAIYKHDDESLSKRTDNLSHRLNFKKFEESEKSNQKLKAYLDLNRYFASMHCKINRDVKNYQLLSKQIKISNLSLRKRILLKTPTFILHFLLKVQQFLVKIGLSRSIFK